MKYLITEAQKYRLYRLAELMNDVAAMDGLNELKPIEPLSDEALDSLWVTTPEDPDGNDFVLFARAIEAHILGEKHENN